MTKLSAPPNSQRRERGAWGRVLLIVVCAGLSSAAPVRAQDAKGGAKSVHVPPEATVDSLFRDFLHYARIGRFTVADTSAKALLAHPDVSPVAVMNAASRDPKSLDTLLILIQNASLGDSAARVLALIEQGEQELRKDPERIERNIGLLGGNPQQEFYAIRHLAESGEYAVPQLVQALLDPARSSLKARVIRALPLLGKSAVNPLVMAIRIDDLDIRQHLIDALGAIGYPQAVPYLQKIIEHDATTNEIRQAAVSAIAQIADQSGRTFDTPAAAQFLTLANRYYNEDDAVRADARLDQANVWYWDADAGSLSRVEVPTKIFGPVMAMRCTEEALALEADNAEAIALWLAANTRREERLAYNVESADPTETGEVDPTRPDVFPRALYFTRAAGPRYAHLMLRRAVQNNDSYVALAAIAALRDTAGESSLVGTEDDKQPLVQALHFPDLAVRIKAGLALGAALPKSGFVGSELVVQVLAATVNLTGRAQLLVIDPDEMSLNRTVGVFRNDNWEVVGAANVFQGLERARVEMPSLRGIVMASDVADPGLVEAMGTLRGEFQFAKTPVLILTKPTQTVLAENVVVADRYAERVDANADDNDLIGGLERAVRRANAVSIDDDQALALALAAASTLRAIAADGRTVYDVGRAEPALVSALSSPHEDLRTRAASVLALLPTDTAQRAIAFVALDPGQTDVLRIAAFGSLSESAKVNGNRLESSQIDDLVRLVNEEPDLTMRTAASQALGAINLATSKASEIIRRYYRG